MQLKGKWGRDRPRSTSPSASSSRCPPAKEKKKTEEWVTNAPEAPCRAPSAPSSACLPSTEKTQSEARKQRMRLVELLLHLRDLEPPHRQLGGHRADVRVLLRHLVAKRRGTKTNKGGLLHPLVLTPLEALLPPIPRRATPRS